MRELAHHSRQERHAQRVEHMCEAIDEKCANAGVTHDYLKFAVRSGIAAIGSFHIEREQRAGRRNACKESIGSAPIVSLAAHMTRFRDQLREPRDHSLRE
jgi:hypothetical protein